MNTERAQVGWSFWLRWVLACAAGLAVGYVVGFVVFEVSTEGVAFAVTFVRIATLVGASIGTAQLLVLQRQLPRSGWWVLASIVGFAVGRFVAFYYDINSASAMSDATIGALTGASIGTAQWLVLRRRLPRSGWWVLANIVGLAVGFAMDFAVVGAVGEAVDGVVTGTIYGAITGGVLVWLLRQSVKEKPSLPQDAT